MATSSSSIAGRPPSLGRYRLHVLGRVLLAVAGGYALAAAFAAGASLWLPRLTGMPRAEAVLLATMLAFVVHAAAAITVFACRSAWKATMTILVPLALFGALLAATLPGGRG